MEPRLTSLDRLLKALADPTRLRIVGLIQRGEICVCHIHDALKISQPKASRHLAYLRRAGVVEGEKRGLWVYYRLAPQPDPVAQTALDTLRHCSGHLSTVGRDKARLEKTARPGPPKPNGEGGGCCPPDGEAPVLACCSHAD